MAIEAEFPVAAPSCADRQSSHPGIAVEAELRLFGVLTPKLAQVLNAIDGCGSINSAARSVGLSYKGAWEMIERANRLLDSSLVRSSTGGSRGGGTQPTAPCRVLLATFFRIQEEHRLFLEYLNRTLADDPQLSFWFRSRVMKASARNQWSGSVAKVELGAVNAEVFVTLKGGVTLVASVTRESVATLGLATGKEVLALVKAPLVIVATDLEGYRLSARNQLAGTVTQIRKGAVNAEVVIGLPGGNSVASSITNESVDSLGLAVGNPAMAVFKAGAVILGVAS